MSQMKGRFALRLNSTQEPRMAQMQDIELQSESQRLAMAPRFLGMKRRVDRNERRLAKDPRAKRRSNNKAADQQRPRAYEANIAV
jgi:hypothetical protein